MFDPGFNRTGEECTEWQKCELKQAKKKKATKTVRDALQAKAQYSLIGYSTDKHPVARWVFEIWILFHSDFYYHMFYFSFDISYSTWFLWS